MSCRRSSAPVTTGTRGTADAIYQNIYTIQREEPDYVLILAGDHVYKMDYSKMLLGAQMSSRVRNVTVGVVDLPKEEKAGITSASWSWTQEIRIVGFEEKPLRPRRPLPEAGFPICPGLHGHLHLQSLNTLYEELIPRRAR